MTYPTVNLKARVSWTIREELEDFLKFDLALTGTHKLYRYKTVLNNFAYGVFHSGKFVSQETWDYADVHSFSDIALEETKEIGTITF